MSKRSKKCDYRKASEDGIIRPDRWEKGDPHHPVSERIMNFLMDHDYLDYDDFFCWKVGGDGDNGETLMYQLDAFFELMDKTGGRDAFPDSEM